MSLISLSLLEEWMAVIAIIGTIAFTLSGYLVGVRKELDLLGITIVATLTAIGGGVIRDVLVSRLPRVFFDSEPVWIILVVLSISFLFKLQKINQKVLNRIFILADSLGLIAFSMTGAQVGLALEFNAFGVASLAFITAVGGGIVRDIMVNDIPFILHKDFYGTISILIGLTLYLLSLFDALNPWSLTLIFVIGLLIRLAAHWRELELPKFE